jgi:hypothetical protein
MVELRFAFGGSGATVEDINDRVADLLFDILEERPEIVEAILDEDATVVDEPFYTEVAEDDDVDSADAFDLPGGGCACK